MNGFALDLVRGELPYKLGKKQQQPGSKPAQKVTPPPPAVHRSGLARDATMRSRRESAAKLERERGREDAKAVSFGVDCSS